MPVGGAEDFALAVSRYFSPQLEVVFLCLRDLGVIGEELKQAGKPVVLLPVAKSRRWNPFGAGKLAVWLRKNQITHVHSQTYHAHTYALPAARKAGCMAIFHQQKTLENLPWHRRWTMGRLSRSASAVLALSEKTAQDLTTVFRLDPARVFIIPNAVDPAVFFPSPNRLEARKSLGFPSLPLIGAVASLNAVKNHHATLAMARTLHEEGRDFRLVFVGEGRERSHLENAIVALQLVEKATLVGNQRPVAPWLEALDVLVLPSLWEGQPMILLQALASGIPIVASAIEGNIAALGKEHPGLFPPGEPQSYVAVVKKILDDPVFKARLLAYQAALPLPTAPKVAMELENIYRSMSEDAF